MCKKAENIRYWYLIINNKKQSITNKRILREIVFIVIKTPSHIKYYFITELIK